MNETMHSLIHLSDEELDQIAFEEINHISKQLMPIKQNTILTTKRILIFATTSLVIALFVTLSLILKTPAEKLFTMDDFYLNITLYEERISEIIENESGDELSSTQELSLKLLSDDLLETYRREDLLNIYLDNEYDFVMGDYLENLLTTQLFIEDITNIILNEEDISLNEEFHPQDDPTLTYRFVMSNEDYIIIEKNNGVDFSYIKMGFDMDLLKYVEMHYSYDLSGGSLSIEDMLVYNYFSFIENKEAVFINSFLAYSTLRYTSIVTGQQFTISYGSQVLEWNQSASDVGYVVNAYNPDTLSNIYLQVVHNTIVGETYDVFTTHGFLYRIDDPSKGDSSYSLYFNVVPATGWDYAKVDEHGSSAGVNAVRGLYLDSGERIYSGHLYSGITPTYAYLGIREDFTQEIDENTFVLDEYGLVIDDPAFTYEAFQKVQIDSFDEVKDLFQVDNLDFFAENLREELFSYLDQDIQSSIVKENSTVDVEGDVDPFLDAIDQVNEYFNSRLTMSQVDNEIISVYDENDSLVSSISTRVSTDLDINNAYYRFTTHSSLNSLTNQSEYIFVYDGKLIKCNVEYSRIDYEVLNFDPQISDFIDALSINEDSNPLVGVISITSTSNYHFVLEVNQDIFNTNIDMDSFFEQQGITGLGQATMSVVYDFNEDYSGYTRTFLIEGLQVDMYDATYSIESTVAIQGFIMNNPFASMTYYLPDNQESILFDMPLDQSNIYLVRSERPGYLRVDLEPGDYLLNGYGDGNASFQIYDSTNQLVSYEPYLHVEEPSEYYIEVTVNYDQAIYISLAPIIIPEDVDIDFSSEGGNINLTMDSSTIYHFHFPLFDEDYFMVVYMNEPSDENVWLFLKMENGFLDYSNYSMNSAAFYQTNRDAYFYIPTGSLEPAFLEGDYVGTVDFDYSFVKVSMFDKQETLDDLSEAGVLLLEDESAELFVSFTVTDSFKSKVYLRVIGIYSSYVSVDIYDENNNLVKYKAQIWAYDFTPGTYTLHIYYDGSSSLNSIGLVKPFFPE